MADGDSQAICDSQASLRWPEGLFPLPLFADINTLILKDFKGYTAEHC